LTVAETIPQLLADRVSRSPDMPAFVGFAERGAMAPLTWRAFAAEVAGVASVLARRGIGRGDRVAIVAPTSIEWEVAQHGALAAGACVAGVDPYYPDAQLADVLDSVAPTVIVGADAASITRMPATALDAARMLIALRGPAAQGVMALGTLVDEPAALDAKRARPDDLALLTFSSGTTGQPKPIAYSHGQVITAVRSIVEAFPQIDEGARLVGWLPLANLFQRMIDFCAIDRGAVTYVVEDPRDVMKALPAANPDLLIGVPRFFEKVHAGVRDRLESGGAARLVAGWAVRQGAKRAQAAAAGRKLAAADRALLAFAERLVLSRVKAPFGTRLRFFVSGSAPMPRWLLEWFDALGLPVLEAYGVSENIVPVAINTLAGRRPGSVGRPLPPNEVRLAPDGEVLVRGSGVFQGYLDRGVLTPAALTADGFWPTGDCATRDEDGYLSLSGRKADLFKLSTGRWVVPAPIEERLRRAPGVDQAVVLGAGRKVPVAIVLVSPETRVRLGAPAAEGALSPDEEIALGRGIERALRDVAAHERPAGILVTTSPFSVAGGEITTNLKVRRRAVEAKHETALARLFAALEHGEPGAMVVHQT
jgi:long-chain acyl-CoA synthetase